MLMCLFTPHWDRIVNVNIDIEPLETTNKIKAAVHNRKILNESRAKTYALLVFLMTIIIIRC